MEEHRRRQETAKQLQSLDGKWRGDLQELSLGK